MKLLVTGGKGQVAWDLIRLAPSYQCDIWSPDKQTLDITDHHSVTTAIKDYQPDAVINTAAYTYVDKAEQEVEQAFAVNRDGAKYLATVCAKFNCPLLHLSTDYVFDGEKTTPYLETDTALPLNIYGESKYQGEQAIRACMERYFIVRVSGVFGVHGNNFVKTMLRLMSERESLSIVADQILCPTPATAIAAMLLQLTRCLSTTTSWGTYHFCGNEAVSWYTFAETIADAAKVLYSLKIKQLLAITSAEYPVAAKRPRYSVLDCHQLEQTFGIFKPSWREGLEDVIQQLSTT